MSASVPEMLLVELYNQCKFAIQAHASAYSALDRFGQAPMDTFGPGRRYQREVFRNLHSLVAHAANLSSALWPPEDAEAAVRDRADRLREVLELSEDDHVLRRLGSAPNPGPYHDRLHRWIEAHEAGGGYLDHIASSAERLADLEAEQRIRTFDPSRRELVLWGQTVRVGEVTEAIKRLCLRLEELLADVDAVRSRHSPRWRPADEAGLPVEGEYVMESVLGSPFAMRAEIRDFVSWFTVPGVDTRVQHHLATTYGFEVSFP